MQNSSEKKFFEDKKQIHKELNDYLNKKVNFMPLYENMEKLNALLKERASL